MEVNKLRDESQYQTKKIRITLQQKLSSLFYDSRLIQ